MSLLWLVLFPTALVVAQSSHWHNGTAFTMPKGQWEKGVFQPLYYGQTAKIEWSTNLAYNLVLPNVRVKMSHGQIHSWQLASRYNAHYPTPLLKMLQRPGTGGIIAPDPDISEIPRILAVGGELLATRNIFSTALLTGRMGIGLALRSGNFDERLLVELPVVFPRMTRYLHGRQVTGGVNLLVGLGNKLDLRLDADLFAIPGEKQSLAFEHKGMILWKIGSRTRLLAGYELIYGEYPFGKQWHLLPLLDIQWTGQRK